MYKRRVSLNSVRFRLYLYIQAWIMLLNKLIKYVFVERHANKDLFFPQCISLECVCLVI